MLGACGLLESKNLFNIMFYHIFQFLEAKNLEALKSASKVLTLPAIKEELVLEGKQESTLDDYENVPISDYGMAMLRGMGWKEGMPIGKNTKA